MSYRNSSLYASKIYAEHPLALWSIDEANYFVSLISQEEKQIVSGSVSSWNLSNATISSEKFDLSGYPFEDLEVNKIFLSTASASPVKLEISLSSPVSYLKFDPNKGSVCVSTHVYVPDTTPTLLSIDIGFIVEGEEFYEKYLSVNRNIWNKLSHTITTLGKDVTPFIRVFYEEDANANELQSSFYINGVSVGNWSEPYTSINTGIETELLPENISSLIGFEGPIQCAKIDSYGYEDSNDGFVLSLTNSLFAELSGVPMVYGSEGSVKLNKNSIKIVNEIIDGSSPDYGVIEGGSSTSEFTELLDGGNSIQIISQIVDGSSLGDDVVDGGFFSSVYTESLDGGDPSLSLTQEEYEKFPSLVFPGLGFLNQFGYNKSLTAEFWLRINPETTSQKRIFGPLSSKDGIYVDKDFIKVNVGNYTKSYFVGKWYRPMLIHFCQSKTEIFLMINGEKVISIPIDSLEIDTFPTKEEDFLGFYTDEQIYIYEIDSFSIFPYIVAEQVAKKRYVFGQGVQSQANIVSPLNGTLSSIDFPFSGYSSTIRYPDRTRWIDGFYNNIVADNTGISLPAYSLPEILFQNTNSLSNSEKLLFTSNFYNQNYSIQDETYPFISMDPNNTYVENNFYGTLYFSNLNQTNYQTRSVHSILKSSSDISTKQSLIYMSSNSGGSTFEIAINSGSIQYLFNDIPIQGTSASISPNSYFAVGIDFDKIEQEYFSTVGSFFSRTSDMSLNFAGNQEDVFLGKVFSLTINNDFFTDKDGHQIFNSNGTAIKNFNESLYNYVGSYTLLPKKTNVSMFLDVGASGYWENSIPLSYFGKFITQANGELKYDLDLVQFNIDSPTSIISKFSQESSSYEESLSTKVFVTLQNITQNGKVVYTQFTNTELIGMDRILDLGEVTSPDNTKYKINDGTVIYPPKDISGFTNYYITIHIEISSKGVFTENVKVKNMGLAALSFDEGQFYSINTPFEGKFYPIIKNEEQYVYKRKIPVVIDTESSPYLYLSGDSGIEVLPEVDENLLKGLAVPINETLKPGQEIVGLQMFLMYNESDSFTERRKIGRIFSSDVSFDIVLVPEKDGKRAFFNIFNSQTGQKFINTKFFLNGKSVTEVVIEPLVWNYISISFEKEPGKNHYPIYLDGILGQIELYSGIKVDNVAVFEETFAQVQQLTDFDEWEDIDDFDWQYWSSSATWVEALNQESLNITILSLDGEKIFNTYMGLSNVVADDDSIFNVNSDSVVIINDARWFNYLV
jgi:hypothetical protein